MTKALFVLPEVERSGLSCVWSDTGNPAQPLPACGSIVIWTLPLKRTRTSFRSTPCAPEVQARAQPWVYHLEEASFQGSEASAVGDERFMRLR